MAREELTGLAAALKGTLPGIQYGFTKKERETERKRKLVSDYYLDLLKRGELLKEEPAPIGPLAGPVPAGEASPLAGYLRPPTAEPRQPTAEETFDILEALSEGERPAGVRTVPTKIPKELKPYEYERAGVTYRRPYEARPTAEITISPTIENVKSFEAYMPGYKWDVGVPQSVPVSSYNRYLSSVRGYKAPDYVKQRDRVLDQATTIWKEQLKSPDVAKLPSADQEKLYLDLVNSVALQLGVPVGQADTILDDPTTLQKFFGAVGAFRFPARRKKEEERKPKKIGLPGIDELFPAR